MSDQAGNDKYALPPLEMLPDGHPYKLIMKQVYEQILYSLGIEAPEDFMQFGLIKEAVRNYISSEHFFNAFLSCENPQSPDYSYLFNNYVKASKELRMHMKELSKGKGVAKKPTTLQDVFNKNKVEQGATTRPLHSIIPASTTKPDTKTNPIAVLIGKPINMQQHKEEKHQKKRAKFNQTARQIKEAIFDRLGRKCGQCGKTQATKWHLDHVNGTTWNPAKHNMMQRAKKYEQDHRNGLLRVLCSSCNHSDGARRKNKGFKARWREEKIS